MKSEIFYSVKLFLFFSIILTHSSLWAQVAINTTGNDPDSSAALDIDWNGKGMLIPRVALTSTIDVTTIASPTNGLVVYNTNAGMTGGNGVGFYYYCSLGCATTGWKFMAAADNGPGTSGQVLTSQGAGNNPTWSTLSSTSTATNPISVVTNEFTAVNGSPCTGAGYTGVTMTLRDCINTCDNYNDGINSDYEVTLTEDLLRAIDIAPNNGNTNYVWTVSPVYINNYSVVRLSDADRNNTHATPSYYCRCVR